jgi:hypothetical protein
MRSEQKTAMRAKGRQQRVDLLFVKMWLEDHDLVGTGVDDSASLRF